MSWLGALVPRRVKKAWHALAHDEDPPAPASSTRTEPSNSAPVSDANSSIPQVAGAQGFQQMLIESDEPAREPPASTSMGNSTARGVTARDNSAAPPTHPTETATPFCAASPPSPHSSQSGGGDGREDGRGWGDGHWSDSSGGGEHDNGFPPRSRPRRRAPPLASSSAQIHTIFQMSGTPPTPRAAGALLASSSAHPPHEPATRNARSPRAATAPSAPRPGPTTHAPSTMTTRAQPCTI